MLSINVAKWAKWLIVMAILLLFSGLMRYYFTAKYQAVVMQERDGANLVSNQLELYLDSRLVALQLMATDPEVVSLDPENINRELRRTVDLLGFFNAVVFDRNGNFIAEGAPEHHFGQVRDGESFAAAVAGNPVVSNRIVYDGDGVAGAYVSLRVPILDSHGETKAVLAAGMPIQEISRMVGSMPLTDPQYIFIFDKYIQMIHSPRNKSGSWANDSVQQLRMDFMSPQKGEIVNKPVVDDIEKKYIYTTVNNTDWRVVMAVPKYDLYTAILRDSFTDMIIFSLILLVIFLLYGALRDARCHQAEVESLRLERLTCVNQLAAGIAHEIRNPLTSIKGFLQLIMRKQGEPVKQSYLNVMSGEIERIEKLISEFQMLARPSNPSHMVKIDLAKTISDVILLMESQAVTRNAILDYYTEQTAWVNGNESQVKQVLINLVRNAIEAVGEKGEIHVSLSVDSDTATVTVQDNGMGIPKEILNRVGTPFYTTKENGTGLGLSICYSIINSHDGDIKIDSNVGKGTTVSVILPRIADFLPASSAPASGG
ncbi:MAG: sensor histidine kinase [Veillonellales bacterium]